MSTLAPHTGRTARNTVATFKANGVTDVPVTVNQAGKPEFVSIQENASAQKQGGNVTIAGKSNSTKLAFTLGLGDLEISVPAKYTANSVETDNDTAIAGDPGAAAEYDFSVVIPVPANETIESLTKQISVTDAGGHTATCNLTQTAGDPRLEVSKSTIDLTWEGTAVSVSVTSNTNWSVS